MHDLSPGPRPRPGPDANLGYLFRLAHQRFRAALDEELGAFGLTARQYGILSLFETRPELSTSEVARLAEVRRQTMHAAVAELEAGRLLERRRLNRRVVMVSLTRTGRACLASATRRVRSVEDAAVAGLSPEEERTVRGWLARIAALHGLEPQAARAARGADVEP